MLDWRPPLALLFPGVVFLQQASRPTGTRPWYLRAADSAASGGQRARRRGHRVKSHWPEPREDGGLEDRSDGNMARRDCERTNDEFPGGNGNGFWGNGASGGSSAVPEDRVTGGQRSHGSALGPPPLAPSGVSITKRRPLQNFRRSCLLCWPLLVAARRACPLLVLPLTAAGPAQTPAISPH